MQFNTPQFAFFFAIVFSLYLALPHRWQNRMLLMASYLFYGAWDWRFLSLILVSTLVDYFCGLKIHAAPEGRRRRYLMLSVGVNLSILGVFKYLGFFVATLQPLLDTIGISVSTELLQLVLPVGISFYTFQTMSYTIDVYRGEIEPTGDLLDFALFVAFFPQLVAGPIERARRLLPQIQSPRPALTQKRLLDSGYLILWGLFLKAFVADGLAPLVEQVYDSSTSPAGPEVLLATYAYAFQIFGDFAGYSVMAKGIALAMGFEIVWNFNIPYAATNPRDLWRRWHISLSTWLRDYLYVGLGGNRLGPVRTYRNLALTMLLGGLWHGAAWRYLLWGAYHGLLLIGHRLVVGDSDATLQGSRRGFTLWRLVRVVMFFQLVCVGWMIFRAPSMARLQRLLGGLTVWSNRGNQSARMFLGLAAHIWLLVLVQVAQLIAGDLMAPIHGPVVLCGFTHGVMLYLLVARSPMLRPPRFIYFQF